jgi:hypothetical protein
MKAENNTARRVLGNYLSAQLQSGLVAMEAALSVQDGELVHQAAQKYLTLAEIAKDFYMDAKLSSSKDHRASHNWGQLLPYLKDYPQVVCKRRHRPARVMGQELVQRGVIHDILQAHPSGSGLRLDFRQRGEVLILRCDAGRPISQRLIIAGQSNPLLAAAREPSINAIKGYLLSRRCAAANIRLRVVGHKLYLHFQVARQLRIPFGT